jgi:4-hydroxybenzoate polyprenyltransferase
MSLRAGDLLLALRPKQWTKNGVVFAAFLFAVGDVNQQVGLTAFWRVALAAACFCLVSSGIYLINDVRDREADRRHPFKRNRPIAAGRIAPSHALGVSVVLIVCGLGGGAVLAPALAGVLGGYVALQIAYTLLLKNLAMIDVFVIASGFVLRAIAGAVVIHVSVSPWLLICTFLLAMFLGLCKRRQEYVGSEPGAETTRVSLDHYDEKLLDQLIAIVASATLVGYAIYTLAPETVEKFGHSRLGFTLPFVMFGLFRYLHLVYRHDLGERPEQVLLTDVPMLLNVALYGMTVMALIYN